MNVYYSMNVTDTGEFLDIGLIADNGEYFYAEFNDYNEISQIEIAEITSNFKFEKNSKEYIRHNHKYSGSFSLEMQGSRYEIRENLELWLEQFYNENDPYIQLVSNNQPYIFYDLQELFFWSLPDSVNDCVFDVNQMLGVSVSRNRFNGKAPLSFLMRSAAMTDVDYIYESLQDKYDLDSNAVLSLKKAEVTRALYSSLETLYFAPNSNEEKKEVTDDEHC